MIFILRVAANANRRRDYHGDPRGYQGIGDGEGTVCEKYGLSAEEGLYFKAGDFQKLRQKVDAHAATYGTTGQTNNEED